MTLLLLDDHGAGEPGRLDRLAGGQAVRPCARSLPVAPRAEGLSFGMRRLLCHERCSPLVVPRSCQLALVVYPRLGPLVAPAVWAQGGTRHRDDRRARRDDPGFSVHLYHDACTNVVVVAREWRKLSAVVVGLSASCCGVCSAPCCRMTP